MKNNLPQEVWLLVFAVSLSGMTTAESCVRIEAAGAAGLTLGLAPDDVASRPLPVQSYYQYKIIGAVGKVAPTVSKTGTDRFPWSRLTLVTSQGRHIFDLFSSSRHGHTIPKTVLYPLPSSLLTSPRVKLVGSDSSSGVEGKLVLITDVIPQQPQPVGNLKIVRPIRKENDQVIFQWSIK